MTNIVCELREIDGEIELCDETITKLTPNMLPSLVYQLKLPIEQKLVYEKLALMKKYR